MNTISSDSLARMTLEEKASLCSGLDSWRTKPIPRLEIPALRMSDGPHGLRKQESEEGSQGFGPSRPATCFPTACATACSFDRDLLRELGEFLAAEAADQEVGVVLGPGVNIKRTPLCGRSFEYFSEDPFLSGELGAAMILGLQSKGVGASLKHFAANSQEKARFVNDSIVDERALREIYLRAFEIAVKKASPETVMCSYNKVNGVYASENERLLRDILREEWGFEGLVMSDWGAVNDRVRGIGAGLDLEMPSTYGDNDAVLVEFVRRGELSEEMLTTSAARVVTLARRSRPAPSDHKDLYEHAHKFAERAARESAVLLKNNGALPIPLGEELVIIGLMAVRTRYQGSGSSRINPIRVLGITDVLEARSISYEYTPGYFLSGREEEDAEARMNEAVRLARENRRVVVFAGLPDEYETEGEDRSSLDLPACQNALLAAVSEANPETVVVLFGGAPVAMPWLSRVNAVLHCHLGGEATAEAVVSLITGDYSPCGKLAQSYPLRLSDCPAVPYCGHIRRSEYRESIFVGYRYYDAAEKEVLFPFGFGLSYSQFEYRSLRIREESDRKRIAEVTLCNIGNRDAAEIVQIYAENPPSPIFRPVRELRGFGKIFLASGEEGTLRIELDEHTFSAYNVKKPGFQTIPGTYAIVAASSSRDIRLRATVVIEEEETGAWPDYRRSAPCYEQLRQGDASFPADQFEALLGYRPDPLPVWRKGTFEPNVTLQELRSTLRGRMVVRLIHFLYSQAAEKETDPNQESMKKRALEDMPLRGLANLSNGLINGQTVSGIVLFLNGHAMRGMQTALRSLKKT